MSKTVPFRMPAKQEGADSWVDQGVESHLKPSGGAAVKAVAMKRLTLDIPAELHARVKMACLQRDKTMLEEICRLMDAEFPAKS